MQICHCLEKVCAALAANRISGTVQDLLMKLLISERSKRYTSVIKLRLKLPVKPQTKKRAIS